MILTILRSSSVDCKAPPIRFTAGVGEHYVALGRMNEDTIVWVWIGTHAEYERLVSS